MPLHLTVAVCTWNRSALLEQTLTGMIRLVVPPEVEWELLVVDNGSTDRTDVVIASFEGRLPLRSVFEPAPGLSNARNRALLEAAGEYILWTDDDVLVDEGWLAGYVEAFQRWPAASVFGGPIEPLFEGEPPDWLPPILDRIGAVFGRQTLGDRPVPLSADTVAAGPYGGNMAMRREALLRYRFDPTLGVCRDEYTIGEETALIRRMLSDGHSGWWTPTARVQHWVPRRNQTLTHVRRWMVGSGRFRAQFPEQRATARRPVGLHRVLAFIVRHEVQFWIRRRFRPPEVWIMDLIHASQARGRLQVVLGRNLGRKAGTSEHE